MKTHADIVNLLRLQETVLKTDFGVREMGLVSPKTEYNPVANVCIFVEGVETTSFDQLRGYIETALDMPAQLISKAAASGSFRYVFTAAKDQRP